MREIFWVIGEDVSECFVLLVTKKKKKKLKNNDREGANYPIKSGRFYRKRKIGHFSTLLLKFVFWRLILGHFLRLKKFTFEIYSF